MISNLTMDNMTIFIYFCWIPIAVIGGLGNILVLLVLKYKRELTSNTHSYIAHLAITDITFLFITVPMTAMSFLSLTRTSLVICQLQVVVPVITTLATCLTLATMTFDRYLAIVDPLRTKKISKYRRIRHYFRVQVTTPLIWLLSLLLALPLLPSITTKKFSVCYSNDTRPTIHVVCQYKWTRSMAVGINIYLFIVSYVAPLFTTIFCYWHIYRQVKKSLKLHQQHRINKNLLGTVKSRQTHNNHKPKPKIIMIMAIVTLAFAISWLPIHIYNLLFVVLQHDFPKNNLTLWLKILFHTLTYINSASNPIIYSFMGKQFRQRMLQFFKRPNQRKSKDILLQKNRQEIFIKNHSLNDLELIKLNHPPSNESKLMTKRRRTMTCFVFQREYSKHLSNPQFIRYDGK
ncbi:hypothetical protein SNEBB_011204 [Seison nebaliae]|nr:hypothetical protein SNEBB_011204 [Seison nebaliae]